MQKFRIIKVFTYLLNIRKVWRIFENKDFWISNFKAHSSKALPSTVKWTKFTSPNFVFSDLQGSKAWEKCHYDHHNNIHTYEGFTFCYQYNAHLTKIVTYAPMKNKIEGGKPSVNPIRPTGVPFALPLMKLIVNILLMEISNSISDD